MSTTLYEITFKKSNRPNSLWVVETDLATGLAKPHHLSTSAFSDNFYRRFAKQNNEVAKYAAKFEIDLGEDYVRLYETGMRVSQQLDGPLRDRTWEQYDAVLKSVQNKLLEGMLHKKAQQRNAELENLVTEEVKRQELSQIDIQEISIMVEALKLVPIKDYKKGIYGERHFDERVVSIGNYEANRYLLPNYWKVHPSLRADYLEVVRFHHLHGKPQEEYMESEEEALKDVLAGLGIVHGKMFLQAVKAEMERDTLKGFMFYRETPNDIKLLAVKYRSPYFEAVFRAQKAGMSRYVDAIPFAVAKLYETHAIVEAQRIAEEAFLLFPAKSELDVLNFLGRHLVKK